MKTMRKNINGIRRAICLMTAVAALCAAAQQRLVINIVVDQLQSDYVELLRPQFGNDGFNRLINNGISFDNVEFDCANVDEASGTAMIMTGTYANINGIPAATVFNTETMIPDPILRDPKIIGNFTTDTYSPARLKVSTISDEVRVNNDGLGYVCALAADAQMAILLAGHAANSVFWIDDISGKWASTTFYKEPAQCVTTRNHSTPLWGRIDNMVWEPLLSLDQYPHIPETLRYYKFNYNFPQSRIDRYKQFKQSALVNEEIATVAIEHIRSLSLGRRGQTDMINIGFTAAPYSYAKNTDNRIELMDTYLRLDRELARIFTYVEKEVGMQNVVVMLTGTGHLAGDAKPDEKFNIPGGVFYADRAISLMNMFLIAKFGNGQWVTGFHNSRFFLNRKLANERNVDLELLHAEAAQFVRQMSGVAAAYTYEEILRNPTNDQLEALHRSMQPDIEGDIVVQTSPGWSIQEQLPNGRTIVTNVRSNAICTPAFIMAPGIAARREPQPIKAIVLAPTLARLLRVHPPNAASLAPLAL